MILSSGRRVSISSCTCGGGRRNNNKERSVSSATRMLMTTGRRVEPTDAFARPLGEKGEGQKKEVRTYVRGQSDPLTYVR
jgi:hypothetical protein